MDRRACEASGGSGDSSGSEDDDDDNYHGGETHGRKDPSKEHQHLVFRLQQLFRGASDGRISKAAMSSALSHLCIDHQTATPVTKLESNGNNNDGTVAAVVFSHISEEERYVPPTPKVSRKSPILARVWYGFASENLWNFVENYFQPFAISSNFANSQHKRFEANQNKWCLKYGIAPGKKTSPIFDISQLTQTFQIKQG